VITGSTSIVVSPALGSDQSLPVIRAGSGEAIADSVCHF
jgi:hypothetical protein